MRVNYTREEQYFSVAPVLADLGYTLADIDKCIYWETKMAENPGMRMMYGSGSAGSFHLSFNSFGKCQILLNMEDGQIILVNLDIAAPPPNWMTVLNIITMPLFYMLNPITGIVLLLGIFTAPLSVLRMFISPYTWLFGLPWYYDVNPILVF